MRLPILLVKTFSHSIPSPLLPKASSIFVSIQSTIITSNTYMESTNFIKGYGKIISSEEDPNYTPNNRNINRNRRKIIAISFTISMTLVIGSLIGALIQASITEPKESNPNPLSSKSDEALKTVCSVTRYPDSCFSSISPLNTPPTNNPLRFFKLSLQASLLETSNLTNLLTESKAGPALKDCVDLFAEALSQLKNSAELIKVKPGEKVLTEMKISDIQTWISAAMTDQETCLDGLEEMGSTVVDELKTRVHKSQEYMSNTLAILNNIESLFHKFGLTMP